MEKKLVEKDILMQSMAVITAVHGHDLVRMTLKKSRSQVFFFEGEENIGKKEIALEWSRHLSCPHVVENATGQACENCLLHFFFLKENVFWVTLENTLDYFAFLMQEYEKMQQKQEMMDGDTRHSLAKTDLLLRLQIRREVMRILFMHRAGIFPLLSEKKKSFPQGEVLGELQLMQFLMKANQWIKNGWLSFPVLLAGKIEKFSSSYFADVLKIVSSLQNCFDRSLIVKKVLDKMFDFCWRKKWSEEPRFVFIDPVEKISAGLAPSLLKILEEPPKDLYFFLFSSSANAVSEQMLAPLLSRAVRLNFSKLKKEEIFAIAQQKWFCPHDEEGQFFLCNSLGFYGEKLDLSSLFKMRQQIIHPSIENNPFRTDAGYQNCFVEHAKLEYETKGAFREGFQIGFLLSVFSSSAFSMERLLKETKYALKIYLEAMMLKKKLNFSLPFYLKNKKIGYFRILLHEISELEFLLQRGTLNKENIFFKWLILLKQSK